MHYMSRPLTPRLSNHSPRHSGATYELFHSTTVQPRPDPADGCSGLRVRRSPDSNSVSGVASMLEVEVVKLRNLLEFGGCRLRLGAFENCRSASKIVLCNNASQGTSANMLSEAVAVLASGQLRQLCGERDQGKENQVAKSFETIRTDAIAWPGGARCSGALSIQRLL